MKRVAVAVRFAACSPRLPCSSRAAAGTSPTMPRAAVRRATRLPRNQVAAAASPKPPIRSLLHQTRRRRLQLQPLRPVRPRLRVPRRRVSFGWPLGKTAKCFVGPRMCDAIPPNSTLAGHLGRVESTAPIWPSKCFWRVRFPRLSTPLVYPQPAVSAGRMPVRY